MRAGGPQDISSTVTFTKNVLFSNRKSAPKKMLVRRLLIAKNSEETTSVRKQASPGGGATLKKGKSSRESFQRQFRAREESS